MDFNTRNDIHEKAACRRYSCRYFAVTSPRFIASEISKPHMHAVRMWVSAHVTKRMKWRAAGIRAYFAVTSPRFIMVLARPQVITHVFYLVLALSRLTPSKVGFVSTHPRHHNTSKPGIPDVDTRFHKHPFEAQVVSRHIKASHSPCRRWVSQAPTRDRSGVTTHQIRTQFRKHSFETHVRGIIAF